MNLKPIKILNNLYFKFEDIFSILEVEGIVSIRAGENKTIEVVCNDSNLKNDIRPINKQITNELPQIESAENDTQEGGLTPPEKYNKIPSISIEKSWVRAAKERKREIFMNTLRPILKKKLSFEFTEVLLEEKAKLLCYKWYESNDKGEEYQGPYLIEEL